MLKIINLFLISLFIVNNLQAEEPYFKEASFSDDLAGKAFYLGLGAALRSLSLLAQLGENVNHISFDSPSMTKECLFLQHIARKASSRFFLKASEKKVFHKTPMAYSSWHAYQKELSEIPALSQEEKKRVLFLENRWLAKSTGFSPLLVNKVYPCFGVFLQTHPETSSSYARSPLIKLSETYKKRVSAWKETLPHPLEFPLVLTRAAPLKEYFLSYFHAETEFLPLIKTLESKRHGNVPVIVDFTSLLQEKDPKKWLKNWKSCRHSFTSSLEKSHIPIEQIICIQRVEEGEIGGIRILPLLFTSSKILEKQHQFLIHWISTFGLSASRVELDRLVLNSSSVKKEAQFSSPKTLCKSKFLDHLELFEKNLGFISHQKEFMLKGALLPLKHLLSSKQWEKVLQSQTLLSLSELSFFRIEKELSLLMKNKETLSFFDFTSHLEQIYANLSSLIEIISPYEKTDFPMIYQDLLVSIPKQLKDSISCGIHSSGMTSLAGILQATRKTLGKSPKVLYGENIYYECINAANLLSNASPLLAAEEYDLKEVDLILAQFNPAWKGLNKKKEYTLEKIDESLKKILSYSREKPLVLALDCTFDFIDSQRVKDLLFTFQNEIKTGLLSVIFYRSGLKFDLFGMDNYCGAPFYLVQNNDPKWDRFTDLLKDPVLQPDRLSLNWFCLAYQTAAPQLEEYRKQIFDNTKQLLKEIPPRFFEETSMCQVIPVHPGVEPTFIDITLKGPLHKFKAALLSGYFSIECLEKGFPLFYRLSIGLYHTNLSILFGEECSTLRLALGLDPAQIEVLKKCFEIIDLIFSDSFSEKEQILESLGLQSD